MAASSLVRAGSMISLGFLTLLGGRPVHSLGKMHLALQAWSWVGLFAPHLKHVLASKFEHM